MGLTPFTLDLVNAVRPTSPAKPTSPSDQRFFGMTGGAKRAMDILIAATAILFLAPVLVLAAIAVKIDGGGAVFFTQRRVGLHGKLFPMIKFRSMRADADAALEELLARCSASRNEWNEYQKLRKDPRITRVGRFLRASSIDELPQLFNVLAGHMSIVGQRPILPSQRDAFGIHIDGYERARPGITGLWQIRGRNRLSFEQRAQMGSEYVNRWSLWLDIKIIAMTVPAVLLSRDAF